MKRKQPPAEQAHLIWPPPPKPGLFRLRRASVADPERVAERQQAVRRIAERQALEDAERRAADERLEPILDENGRVVGRKRSRPNATPGVVHHPWRNEHIAFVGPDRPPDAAGSDGARIADLERQVAQLTEILRKDH